MTIAIAAVGSGAGLAIIEGLRAAESVATGAIGGFAVLAVLTPDGHLHRYETQRGGSRTLFIEGETTGVAPPQSVQGAIAAALISSGPDRPIPLAQFLTADPDAGLVTAHRVPQGPSVSGVPLNLEVLNELKLGKSAQAATQTVLDRNPFSDVGFITIDRSGNLHVQNSRRVQTRPDLGMADREADGGIRVGVLHNALEPHGSLAALVADIVLGHMVDAHPIIGWITVSAGIPLVWGEVDAVDVDEAGQAWQIVTRDPTFTQGDRTGVGIYLHSQVRQQDTILGKTLVEPLCVVQEGILQSMSGQLLLRLGYTHYP